MILKNHEDLVVFLTGPVFSKWNPGFETEKNLLNKGILVYDHHATQCPVVRLRSAIEPKQEEKRVEAKEAKYWYRAMTKQEYTYLKKKEKLNINYEDIDVEKEDKRYIGIAPNYSYSKGYMGNTRAHTHLIEFEFLDKVNFNEEMVKLGKELGKVQHVKAEGGGTYGLGQQGHYKGEAGKRFNDLLYRSFITWRLTYLVLKYVCPNNYKVGGK